jgi:hypothetical protein
MYEHGGTFILESKLFMNRTEVCLKPQQRDNKRNNGRCKRSNGQTLLTCCELRTTRGPGMRLSTVVLLANSRF